MKKTTLAAAVAAAALSLPALAHAQDGYVDLSYRDANDLDTSAITVGGAVAVDVGGAKLQFNANHARADAAGADTSASDFVAHAYKQNEQYAIGGFVSGTDVLASGVYGIGVEGSWYIDNLTLGGAISYNGADNGGGHFNNYGATARYFVTENFAVAVNYDTLDYSGGGDLDAWSLEAEFQTSTPVSVFAAYGNVDAGAADFDKWGLGVRYNFGGKSLKEQERSGAKAMRSTSAIARVAF